MDRNPQHLLEFGPFILDVEERLLLREGQRVALTPKVFETLVALVEHRGRLVEKDKLMKLVWPDSFVEEANLTNNISTLRRALGEGESGANYIETIPRIGYRFSAPVRELPRLVTELVVEKHSLTRIETEEEIQSEGVAPVVVPVETVTANATVPRSWLKLRWALFIAAAIVVVFVTSLAGLWLIRQRQTLRARSIRFVDMNMSRVTTSGNTRHAAISPDGRYVAQVTEDNQGYSLWVRHVAAPNSVRISGPSESDYLWVSFAPDGNSIYYITLERDKGDTALYQVPMLGGPSTMTGYDFWPVAFSPDGKQMAFIRMWKNSESVLIIADADGTERAIAKRHKPEYFRGEWNAPAWSPDGKTIACPVRLSDDQGEFETIVGIDAKSGSQTLLTQKRWTSVGQPAWLADGAGVLLTAREGSTLPRQVWSIAIPGGEAERITHDLNDYHDLSLTQDSSKFAVVQDQTVSNIWVSHEAEAAAAKQIVSEIGTIELLAWTPDGRIVFHSNAGQSAEIWVTKADGTERHQLTTDARVSSGLTVSSDDRYIFFASDRRGHFNIWRVDVDGQNPKQLTFGDGEFFPECTPDGEWVVYQSGYFEPKLWKMRVDGSSPVQLTVTRASRPDVSADGQMIAYHYLDPEIEKSQWSIGIVSAQGGARLQRLALPPTLSPTVRLVRWSPDRKSIAFVNRQNGRSDIWAQPLDGGPAQQRTNFKAEQILAFDWSWDGHSLAFIRRVDTSDVVLIDGAR